MAKLKQIKHLVEYPYYRYLQLRIHTPLETAVQTINERRKDKGLIKEVETFLDNDIPAHFKADKPVFYFCRYLATPDYETMMFLKQVKSYQFPIVISEDRTDKLTSHGALKRNLMKLPVVVGHTRSGSSIIQNFRVGDLNAEQGKAIKDVRLLNGTSLVSLHQHLCDRLLPKNVLRVQEAEWVSRHQRGNLVSLYEKMLALLIVHGIMVEIYEPDEIDFMYETVLPAMKLTEARFGHTPLIAPLVRTKIKGLSDYNSYPGDVANELKKLGVA